MQRPEGLLDKIEAPENEEEIMVESFEAAVEAKEKAIKNYEDLKAKLAELGFDVTKDLKAQLEQLKADTMDKVQAAEEKKQKAERRAAAAEETATELEKNFSSLQIDLKRLKAALENYEAKFEQNEKQFPELSGGTGSKKQLGPLPQHSVWRKR